LSGYLAWLLEEFGNHRHGVRTCLNYRLAILNSDAADCYQRLACVGASFTDPGQADCGVGILLGQRSKNRTYGYVIGRSTSGGVNLLAIVSRHAQHPARSDNLPRRFGWNVILSDVDAVGLGGEGEIGSIINNQRGFTRQNTAQFTRQPNDLLCGGMLLAYLEQSSAAGNYLARKIAYLPKGPRADP